MARGITSSNGSAGAAGGPVVVVTGGSAGVGRAAALAFARQGAAVAVLARGVERLEDARREIEALGVPCLAVPTDVADPDAVEQAAAAHRGVARSRSTSGSTAPWRRCSRPSTS